MVKIKKKLEIRLKSIIYYLFIIFLLYIVVELIRKILGGSLGFEELMIALLVANLGYSFHISNRISKVGAKLSNHLGMHEGYRKAKKENK